jgi:2-(1,2-epoxy-1,2-dihydrophenyl)acetyl-CoA isomerase
MAHEILTEVRGNALIVTLNRPLHGNMLSLDMANQLFQALKLVTTDRAIRAVMLRGQGEHFMSGLDLSIYGGTDFTAGIERNNELLLPYHSIIRELYVMDKPVLSVVTGTVAGPGLSLILASDLVLAGRNTTFSAGFTSNAMTPDGGASFFLTRKVGAAKATEILMLNETFDAVTAEKLHIINGLCDDDKLQDEALQWIDRLASGPTKAFAGVKRLVGRAFEQDIHAHLALEHAHWGSSSRTFDFREAMKAHVGKRAAKYTGS